MIANELEYRTTKAALRRLEEGLAHIGDCRDERDPLAQQVLSDSIGSEIAVLREQLDEYEALRSGQVAEMTLSSLSDLPNALIAARIAAGWSQQELANRMELKHQQIQRYEATRYASASFDRLLEIAGVLGLETELRARFGQAAAMQQWAEAQTSPPTE